MKQITEKEMQYFKSLNKAFNTAKLNCNGEQILNTEGNYSIIIYGVKSERKNTKCNHKEVHCFGGDTKLKKLFKKHDISELIEFCIRNDYSKFKLVVYYNNINLHNWNTDTFYSIESVLQRATTFKELINSRIIIGGFTNAI